MPDGDTIDTVTMTKAEAEELRAVKALTNEVWNHKDFGLSFKRAVKAVRPASRIPELDIAEPLVASLTAQLDEQKKAHQDLLGKLAKDKQEADDRKAEIDLVAAIDAAQNKFRLDDEGRGKMIQRMRDNKSADAEAAAAWVAAATPAAAPLVSTGLTPSSLNLFGAGEKSDNERVQLLHTNPEAWFASEVNGLMSDPDFLAHPERY